MSADTAAGPRRALIPLVAVSAAALVFAILLILVRVQWAPLESADHGAAAHLNHLVAGHAAIVSVVKAVTYLGSNAVLWTVIAAAVAVLAIRKRWWLAGYLLVTGAGALVLDPVLKTLVGRLRPVVAHPIAYGTGDSFPSGHSLGSIVCYGAILLVFLPAARGRWRPAFITVITALVVLIGISRILLGVHFLSDVIGAWALGITWLGVTAFAFELTRQAAGRPVTDPVTEGLEPEARADLKPAEPERADGHAPDLHRGRIAAAIVVAWVLIVGLIIGIGELIVKHGHGQGNLLGDRTIPHWFAAHRTSALTSWSQVFSTLGATQAILIVALATCVVFLAVTRRWRPVVFLDRHVRGARSVPHRRRGGQAAQAGCHPPGQAPAHLGLPLRAHGRHYLPVCRDSDPGDWPRSRLVALAVPHPGHRHAGPGRAVPHVPGRAPPDRYSRQPAIRRPLADRDHFAH